MFNIYKLKGLNGIDWQTEFFEMQAELVLETPK